MKFVQKIIKAEAPEINYDGFDIKDIPHNINKLSEVTMGEKGSKFFNSLTKKKSGKYTDLFVANIPQTVSLYSERYDMELIRSILKIKHDILYRSKKESTDGITFCFSVGNENKDREIFIPTDEIKSYIMREEMEYSLFKETEVYKWENSDDVAPWFLHKFHRGRGIKGKYYHLLRKEYDKLKELDPEFDIEWSENLFVVLCN